MAEIDQLDKRIKEETPPSGVLYYKYIQKENAEEENKEEANQVANRKIEETTDKSKVKIRFSDLPISKST